MPVKNIIPGQVVTKEKLQRAKELRKDMTHAEKILWMALRANKLAVHFRSPPPSAPPPNPTRKSLDTDSKSTSSDLGEAGGGR